MDVHMQRSLNGYRNNEMILRAVESKENTDEENEERVKVFRLTLRCIKHWSKKQGLNSNKMGYLGGIAWAILVAKICQMFPKLSAVKLLEKFFYIYGFKWDWSTMTIMIAPEELEEQEKNKMKQMQKFNILTPAYPQSNSTHNINQCTKDVILTAFKAGYELVKEILDKDESPNDDDEDNWKKLFKEFCFFDKYNHYLEVNVVGKDEKDYASWKGFIEAKIRLTSKYFEEFYKMYSIRIHYWPYFYNSTIKTTYALNSTMYIGMKVLEKYDEKIDLTFPIWNFINEIDDTWEKNNPKRQSDELNLIIVYRKKSKMAKERTPYYNPKESDCSNVTKVKPISHQKQEVSYFILINRQENALNLNNPGKVVNFFDFQNIIKNKRETNIDPFESLTLDRKISTTSLGIDRPCYSPAKVTNPFQYKVDKYGQNDDNMQGKHSLLQNSMDDIQKPSDLKNDKNTKLNEQNKSENSQNLSLKKGFSNRSQNLDDLLD